MGVKHSTIDMKLDSFYDDNSSKSNIDTYRENFNLNYNFIIQNLNNSKLQDEMFNKFYILLDLFTTKYCLTNEIKNITDDDNFISETKKIFTIIHNLFTNEEMIKEMEDDINNASKQEDIDDYTNELNDYNIFLNNIKYITNNIDEIDLRDTNTTFTRCAQECLHYLTEKKKQMEELNDDMKNLNDKLSQLENLLQKWNTQIVNETKMKELEIEKVIK